MMAEIDLTVVIVSITLLAGLFWGVLLAARSSRRKSWIEEFEGHFDLKSDGEDKVLAGKHVYS